MEIYYVKLDDNLFKNLSKPELKKLQSSTGRKIVDYAGAEFYKITDREIIIENNKPKFKNSDIQFSISHSNQIVAVAFDDYPIGLDVEYMKERDFKSLGQHYDINTDDKIDFYKKWTQLEAEIKLQVKPEQIRTEILLKEYMMSAASSKKVDFIIKKQELKLDNLI